MAEITLYNGAYTGPQVDAAISRALAGGAIDTEIAALKAAVGSPLVAATVAAMTNINKIYVYTGSEFGYTAGNWYYWSGSAWASGGVYNSNGYNLDDTPTQGSDNPAKSGGIYDAIKTVKSEIQEDVYKGYDDVTNIIKITSTTTTLGDINTMLNGAGGVNIKGDHVFFDLSALGVMMYLCTIFIDTASGVYKVLDLVSGRYAEGNYTATTLLTMATAQANGMATQAQIDYLQGEIDELGGKSVLANWDVLGDKIADGTSTDIISPGDIVDINWITSALGTTTSGLAVTCSNIDTFAKGVGAAEATTYLFVFDGTDWTYNSETVNLADFALSVSGTPTTGEVMTIVTTVEARPHTFTSYDTINPVDNTVAHNWLLERTYAPNTMVYDTYEALFAVYAGKTVPVGNYHLRNYSYRSAMQVDMYLSVTAAIGNANEIVQVASNGYSVQNITNADSVTKTGVYVISTLTPRLYGKTTQAAGTIAIAYTPTADVTYTELADLNTDPADPVVYINAGQIDMCALGNNAWPLSNIAYNLNDDTAAKTEYTPTHILDRPSNYDLGAGYLFGIDPRVMALIQEAEVKWTAGYGKPDYTQGTTYTAQQKVFLLSMREMSFTLNPNEGTATQLYAEYTNNAYTDNAVAARAKYNKAGGTLNNYRWSRSAGTGVANIARQVASTGAYYNNDAIVGRYVAPAFIIGKSA